MEMATVARETQRSPDQRTLGLQSHFSQPSAARRDGRHLPAPLIRGSRGQSRLVLIIMGMCANRCVEMRGKKEAPADLLSTREAEEAAGIA